MAYQLNLSTCEITEVSEFQAETAMKNYGYKPETVNRLRLEATIFYTGDSFYSRDRYRLEEEVRENAATAPSPFGTAEIQNLCQLSQVYF